jgi:plasmid stability protein
MANRQGVFIGAYVPNHLKESLRRRAAAQHRTLSQEITRILEDAAGLDYSVPAPAPETNSNAIENGDAWAILESMKGTIEAPSDFASELDHYLYGTPKRSESRE